MDEMPSRQEECSVTLKVLGVSFSYGARRVLSNVSLELRGGEFIGLMGPNGSGKTTLLKVMNRVLKPSCGSVLVDDVDISKLRVKDVAKLFGTVSQEYDTSFSFTALDVVLMGRNPHLTRLRGESSRDYEVAIRSMKMTNTLHFADRPFNELSGGEKQRVMIARALAQEPRVLLLDEPTSHLDISNQIELLELLKRLCRDEGILVVAVIHDFNLASYYCDKVVLMKSGVIHSMGSPVEVLTPQGIEEVFGVKVTVRRHPDTGMTYITPIPIVSRPQPLQGKRVHVICGGGTGGVVLRALSSRGFMVTAGVLNLLDSDYEVAREVCLDVAREAPFSPITREAHEHNLKLIRESDVVVLTDVPFGWGNLKNLEAALKAVEYGKPVYLVKTGLGLADQAGDYTGGLASKLLQELSKSAKNVSSVEELLSALA